MDFELFLSLPIEILNIICEFHHCECEVCCELSEDLHTSHCFYCGDATLNASMCVTCNLVDYDDIRIFDEHLYDHIWPKLLFCNSIQNQNGFV